MGKISLKLLSFLLIEKLKTPPVISDEERIVDIFVLPFLPGISGMSSLNSPAKNIFYHQVFGILDKAVLHAKKFVIIKNIPRFMVETGK